MNDYLKYGAGAGLFALWLALVLYLKLDPSDLISTIKLSLFAILGYAGVTKLQAAPSDPAQPITPPKPTSAPTVPLGGAQ
jgi:hypothetical protein